MEKITITEALSEVNLLKKKIEKKKETVLANLAKAKHMPDPFKDDGGSFIANKANLQSIQDLNHRLIRIRSGISSANLTNSITLGNESRTIADWLTWKREVSQSETKFLSDLTQRDRANREHWSKSPQVYKDDTGATHLVEFESNIDYASVIKQAETLGDQLEKLDGQLSLKNATITIEV